MNIAIDTSVLARSRWHEYLVRFVFGGAITALAGVVAMHWGPVIGGLFLAFPSIFPATATLLEKHERQKKEAAGKRGVLRARAVAGVDAAGAAMGSIGLIAFAVIVWRWIPSHSPSLTLGLATLAWVLTAVLTWYVRKTMWGLLRTRFAAAAGHIPSVGGSGRTTGKRRSHE